MGQIVNLSVLPGIPMDYIGFDSGFIGKLIEKMGKIKTYSRSGSENPFAYLRRSFVNAVGYNAVKIIPDIFGNPDKYCPRLIFIGSEVTGDVPGNVVGALG